MPCEGGYTGDQIEGYVKSANDATRAACDMRTILRRHKLLKELTVETLAWISQHDKEDAARIAEEEESNERERKRIKALNKLSLEERRVLGL